jgi:hypothetical protein
MFSSSSFFFLFFFVKKLRFIMFVCEIEVILNLKKLSLNFNFSSLHFFKEIVPGVFLY